MTAVRAAVVTGGRHGIGRACVERLTADGFAVVFAGRDRAAGAEVERAAGGSLHVTADVTSGDDLAELVARALDRGDGRLAALVNAAGQAKRIAFADSDLADWDAIFAVNTRAVYEVTRLALDGLIAGRGSVATISSVAGHVGDEGLALYAASKAALIALPDVGLLQRAGGLAQHPRRRRGGAQGGIRPHDRAGPHAVDVHLRARSSSAG